MKQTFVFHLFSTNKVIFTFFKCIFYKSTLIFFNKLNPIYILLIEHFLHFNTFFSINQIGILFIFYKLIFTFFNSSSLKLFLFIYFL